MTMSLVWAMLNYVFNGFKTTTLEPMDLVRIVEAVEAARSNEEEFGVSA